MRAFALAAMAAALIGAAPVSQSFNLNCSGTMTTKSLALNDSKPYTKTYRVKLAERKWCEDECETIRDIAEVQPATLILRKAERTVPGGLFHWERVDRRTGRHDITSTTGERAADILILKWDGTCERTAFTGFPSFTTKF